MPGMKRPMRDDRHTLSLVVSAVVAAVLARIGAAPGSRHPPAADSPGFHPAHGPSQHGRWRRSASSRSPGVATR